MRPTCGFWLGVLLVATACSGGTSLEGDGTDALADRPDAVPDGSPETDADGAEVATDGADGEDTRPYCGDGAVDTGEECDDGNEVAHDGCDPDCTFSCHDDSDCDDGLDCSGDECVATDGGRRCVHSPLAPGMCVIDGACWTDGTVDPTNPCRLCASPTSGTEWTPRPTGFPCADDLFCNGAEACDGAGTCVAEEPGCGTDLCAVCDETADACRPAAAGIVCRSATGSCDLAESCDGSSEVCPPDAFRPAGTPCDDGDACTAPDACDGAGACVGDPAATVPPSPVPRAPRNAAATGSPFAPASFATLRPTFRWSWADDGCAAPVFEIEVDDRCPMPGFAACEFRRSYVHESGIATTTWQPAADLPVDTRAPVGRRYFWRVRACRGSGCSAWSPVRYVDVGRLASDFNGDGYADLAVGAPGEETADHASGRVHLYAGSSTGIPSTPTLTIVNPADVEPDARAFGSAISAGGDINADGFADLLVGPSSDGDMAFVFVGGPSGLGPTPAMVLAPPGLESAAFGSSLAVPGDINADGYADAVVAASRESFRDIGDGSVYVYLGGSDPVLGPPGAIRPPDSAEAGGFGRSVAGGGDVNGDGYADLIVGSGRGVVPRAAYVLRGCSTGIAVPTTVVLVHGGYFDGGGFGASSAMLDLDGDDFDDVVFGDSSAATDPSTCSGVVVTYRGSAEGVVPEAWTETTCPGGFLDLNRFGEGLAPAGDVTGDGFADLLVAASGDRDFDPGSVLLYEGSATGIYDTPPTTWVPPEPQDEAAMGSGSSGALDLDGDGLPDLAIGAPGYSAGARLEGNVFVYLGAAAGPPTTPSLTLDSPENRVAGRFGEALSGGTLPFAE